MHSISKFQLRNMKIMADKRELRRIRYNKTSACPFYYLNVSLHIPQDNSSNVIRDKLFFKKCILDTLRECYGEMGASTNIDILSYNGARGRGIIRVESAELVKIRIALALTSEVQSRTCHFTIHKSSPFLASLSVNSRTYNHHS